MREEVPTSVLARGVIPANLRDRDAGQFESARSGFADYARDGESAKELRARVNRTILEDLEAKVWALRALHTKFETWTRENRSLRSSRDRGPFELTRGRMFEIHQSILDVRGRDSEAPSVLEFIEEFPAVLLNAPSLGKADEAPA